MLQNRKGFTLIELLIVVVIIGILAAIAIPKFANTKEKAYVASMKSDLKNLSTAEEGYFADSLFYIGDGSTSITQTAPLTNAAGTTIFAPSAGVTVVATAVAPSAGTQAGWQASATHSATNVSCDIFVNATSLGAAKNEGEPACQ
ncbi:MAG TPA: prepilin-type N-terminal cleavage/methylation domain-containing protein [Gemmatimonadaceae bacterium]|jgi:prepilin-type N-terminal cleavage/methylation domain-containing protein